MGGEPDEEECQDDEDDNPICMGYEEKIQLFSNLKMEY